VLDNIKIKHVSNLVVLTCFILILPDSGYRTRDTYNKETLCCKLKQRGDSKINKIKVIINVYSKIYCIFQRIEYPQFKKINYRYLKFLKFVNKFNFSSVFFLSYRNKRK